MVIKETWETIINLFIYWIQKAGKGLVSLILKENMRVIQNIVDQLCGV